MKFLSPIALLLTITALTANPVRAANSDDEDGCVSPADPIAAAALMKFYRNDVFPVMDNASEHDTVVTRTWHAIQNYLTYLNFSHDPAFVPGMFDESERGTPGAKLIVHLATDVKLNHDLVADRALWAELAAKDTFSKDPAYRKKLAKGADLHFLYAEPSGVSEGYSIGEHSSRVLGIYNSQKKFYDLDSIHKPADVRNLDVILAYTLALHDIGKSIANRGGDKGNELDFSVPIVRDVSPHLGFNAHEAALATALVDTHQLIGTTLKMAGGRSGASDQIRETRQQIIDTAKRVDMEPGEFYKLMQAVFTADAASYPRLHEMLFHAGDDGHLIPNDQKTIDALNPAH